MAAKWYFNKLRPGDKTREPIQGEFFATDAIRNSVEALIREGNQNTLDAARSRGTEPVSVRLYLATGQHGLPATQAAKYFDGAHAHFTAPGNGLRDVPGSNDPCPFLVFEDFGTTGLQGETTQWHDIAGAKNSFFYFFRAEGRSGKGQQDRGRLGVGKYVFPRMSRISSFFGLTKRADDNRTLLMGQAVLKSHEVAGGYYSPDGLFGEEAANGLILPT
jgi:hypothetical protein